MSRIIILLLLIVGLGAGLYLVQHPQIFNPKAYYPPELGYDPGERTPYQLEKGFIIELKPEEVVPEKKIFDLLEPKWVRFVYFHDKGIPGGIPSDVKILLVFNNQAKPEIHKSIPTESSTAPPESRLRDINKYTPEDSIAWKKYTDEKFLPVLDEFLKTNPRVDAFQIWNEQDLCLAKTGDCIPADAYAYMLKKSAQMIKAHDPKIKVIMGGVASGQVGYVDKMKDKSKGGDPDVFSQVDAIGVHPYGKSPDGWCQYGSANQPEKAYLNDPMCKNRQLPFGDLGEFIRGYKEHAGIPVWISEIGEEEHSDNWEAEYLKRIYAVFSREKVPAAFWFTWSDHISAQPSDKVDANGNPVPQVTKFGLVDTEGAIKQSGVEFKHLP